jgi:hypothetical protein
MHRSHARGTQQLALVQQCIKSLIKRRLSENELFRDMTVVCTIKITSETDLTPQMLAGLLEKEVVFLEDDLLNVELFSFWLASCLFSTSVHF